jgi:hypothetical protein
MTLQQDVQEKILSEENELRKILFNFVNEIDDDKRPLTKIKEELLIDIREFIMEEEGEE